MDKSELVEHFGHGDLTHLHWLAIFVAAIAHNGPVEISDKALIAAPRLVDGVVGSLVMEHDQERHITTFRLLDAPGVDIPYAGA